MKLICERTIGIGISELTDILQVKEALVRLFAKCGGYDEEAGIARGFS